MEKEDIKAIADLSMDNDFLIISDEIYEKIIYDKKHYSPAKYSDNVITLNGFSKTYAMTGLRIGYLTANEEYTTYTTYEGETDYRGHYWTSTKYAFVRDVTFMYFWSTNDVRIGWCASQNEMPIRPVIPLKAVSIQRL